MGNIYDDMNSILPLRGEEDVNPDGYGDGSVVATEDGCSVEPDGRCEHGYESPLRRLGLC
jgi:hypothetical protein